MARDPLVSLSLSLKENIYISGSIERETRGSSLILLLLLFFSLSGNWNSSLYSGVRRASPRCASSLCENRPIFNLIDRNFLFKWSSRIRRHSIFFRSSSLPFFLFFFFFFDAPLFEEWIFILSLRSDVRSSWPRFISLLLSFFSSPPCFLPFSLSLSLSFFSKRDQNDMHILKVRSIVVVCEIRAAFIERRTFVSLEKYSENCIYVCVCVFVCVCVDSRRCSRLWRYISATLCVFKSLSLFFFFLSFPFYSFSAFIRIYPYIFPTLSSSARLIIERDEKIRKY